MDGATSLCQQWVVRRPVYTNHLTFLSVTPPTLSKMRSEDCICCKSVSIQSVRSTFDVATPSSMQPAPFERE